MSKDTVESPMTQLAWRIKESKYALSKEEILVIINHNNKMKMLVVEGALIGFTTSYFVLSKFKKFPRRLISAGVAYAGASISNWGNETRVINQLLQLEESPVAGELVHILQEDFPNHPSLKQLMNKKHDANSQLVFDEEGEKGRRRLPPKVDLLSSDQDHVWATQGPEVSRGALASKEDVEGGGALELNQASTSLGGQDVKKVTRAARSKLDARDSDSRSEGMEQMGSESQDTNRSSDLFSFPLFEEEERETQEMAPAGKYGALPRKSNMSAVDRREYNRKRYLEWQRTKQQQTEEAVASKSSWRNSDTSSSFTSLGSSFLSSSFLPAQREMVYKNSSSVQEQLWNQEARKVLKGFLCQ